MARPSRCVQSVGRPFEFGHGRLDVRPAALHPRVARADQKGVMPGIPSRPYPYRTPRLLREDDGFGLIEVMVSAVLVVVLALATLKLLDGAQRVSSNNRSRDVAAQLAQSAQDAIRQMPITALAGGYHPGPATQQVGGITYTIDSTADWVQDSGGPVTCSTS